MIWTPVNFGKYKGKTLPQILFQDPDWFFHVFDDGAFRERQTLRPQAEDIHNKARRIRIPVNPGGQLMVEYYFDRMTGAFSHFEFVPPNRPKHDGPTRAIRFPTINMRAPRAARNYDKRGYQEFIRLLKQHVFGETAIRITKQRAEQFFSNPKNFDFEVNLD